MPHEAALRVVHDVNQQLAGLLSGYLDALKDGKVSPFEGIALGMKGLSFGAAILTILRDADAATQADVLYVLEHAVLTMPEAGA